MLEGSAEELMERRDLLEASYLGDLEEVAEEVAEEIEETEDMV